MEGHKAEESSLDTETMENKNSERKHTGALRQIFFSFVIASTSMQLGMVTGWSGILMKMSSDPDASVVVPEEDAVWLVSLLGLVWTFSSLVSGPLMEYVGLRRLLMLCLPPSSLCWVTLAHPPGLWAIYVGRIGSCVIAGVINALLQPLLAELCHARFRGFVLTLPEVLVSVGLLLSYVLPRFLSWQVATFLLATPFVPLFFLMFFVPESPYWLTRRNKTEEVRRALRRLDPSSDVAEEMMAIRSSCAKELSAFEQLRELRNPHNNRPVLLVLFLFLLRELGGPSVIFMYSAYMFSLAGVQLDAFTCSILVGAARLASTILSAFVSDSVGRRVLLLGTAAMCAVAQALAGGSLLLARDADSANGALSLLPLVGVLVYVASYGVGLAPIPWVLVGELFPTPVRSFGAAIVSSTFALTVFGINFVFPKLIVALSLGGTFVLFACVNAALCLLVFFFVPETSGLTLQEVQLLFANKLQRSETPDKLSEVAEKVALKAEDDDAEAASSR